ncbi:MAG: L-serine ammonia-lyase, iron-sulfur-dependent, subunit alpha, partial [Tissierellia bacterium]|nr:L-serine ammonia-lyase, iron-sulfur-dependent, subunit alpha [Tissierellia bacterium]
MFKSGADLLDYCKANNLTISEAVLKRDAQNEEERKILIERSEKMLDIMINSATKGIKEEVHSLSGMIGGNAKKLYDYAKKGDTLSGDDLVKAMAMALSVSEVNAAMGKIVAAPTAGAAGIMPAILKSAHE